LASEIMRCQVCRRILSASVKFRAESIRGIFCVPCFQGVKSKQVFQLGASFLIAHRAHLLEEIFGSRLVHRRTDSIPIKIAKVNACLIGTASFASLIEKRDCFRVASLLNKNICLLFDRRYALYWMGVARTRGSLLSSRGIRFRQSAVGTISRLLNHRCVLSRRGVS